MKTFQEHVTEFRRRFILRILSESPDYVISDILLRGVLSDADLQVSMMAGDLEWLKDAGLIARKAVDDVLFSRLTPRGLDVIKGTATAPGVARADIGA